jgi:DNA recombination protein RmuC
METRASELQSLIQDFKGQWDKFTDKMERVGKSLDQAQNHYHELETTRVRQIEKPVEKILDLEIDQNYDKKQLEKK